jgi:hypothetical protein
MRVAFSESHDEILNSTNNTELQSILKDLDFSISFIREEFNNLNINNVQVLIVGGPTEPFSHSEVVILEKFVEKQGGFVLLLSVAGGDLGDSNLSELTRRFEFEFNPDFVESFKHNENNNPRIPILRYIKRNFPFTKGVKKIIYTGCSISKLDSSIEGFLFTDKDSIPTVAPLAVISNEKNIIGIGSASIFNDTLIKKFDNMRLIRQILKHVKDEILEKEKELRTKYKNLTVSKALKLLEHQITINIKLLDDVSNTIDSMWNRITQSISRDAKKDVENNLKKSYKLILHKIDTLASQIARKNAEFSFLGEEYNRESNQLLNTWYISEAEAREKLDMIRNNLVARIENS